MICFCPTRTTQFVRVLRSCAKDQQLNLVSCSIKKFLHFKFLHCTTFHDVSFLIFAMRNLAYQFFSWQMLQHVMKCRKFQMSKSLLRNETDLRQFYTNQHSGSTYLKNGDAKKAAQHITAVDWDQHCSCWYNQNSCKNSQEISLFVLQKFK